jgi:hypothetical protein
MEEQVSEGTGDGTQGAQENGATAGEQSKTFTQDEVNQLVGQARVDERRKVQSKFADYDEVKAKAGESKSLEERLAEVERRAQAAEAEPTRSRVAATFGISTKKGPNGEPSDADLFLTGADEDTLTAQAKRLADREADRKKRGGVAPKEGGSADNGGGGDSDLREFTRSLFGRADD